MIKIICDCCGCEKAKNKFSYLCHLDVRDLNGYIDNEGNSISCREVSVDLCNKCYNEIVSKAVVELKKRMKS